MPAVFGTAELAGTFKWIKNISINKKIIPDNKTIQILIITGLIILSLILIFPKIFYPFVWVSVFLLIEPINIKVGNKSIFEFISIGEGKPLFALAIGGLICGFFWEMWNYYSYPKWKYFLPGVNVFYFFEMPLPGYIGYIPFPLELYAVFQFITGIFKVEEAKNYIQVL